MLLFVCTETTETTESKAVKLPPSVSVLWVLNHQNGIFLCDLVFSFYGFCMKTKKEHLAKMLHSACLIASLFQYQTEVILPPSVQSQVWKLCDLFYSFNGFCMSTKVKHLAKIEIQSSKSQKPFAKQESLSKTSLSPTFAVCIIL